MKGDHTVWIAVILYGAGCLNIWIFFFISFLEMATDCHELFLRGETTSGVYTIQPINAEPFKVFCEMTAGKQRENFPHFALCVFVPTIANY